MRGIVISPVYRTIKEVDVQPGIEGIYAAMLDADPGFTGRVEVVQITPFDDMFIDEEGNLSEGRFIFDFHGRKITGSALILAHDDGGESVSTDVSLKIIKKVVSWTNLETTGDFGPSSEGVIDHPILGPNTPYFKGGEPIFRERSEPWSKPE